MKRFLLSLMLFISSLVSFGQHLEIVESNLPGPSQAFLNEYYSNEKYRDKICFVEYDDDSGRVEGFDVLFYNGTKVEFDKNGRLESVTCSKNDTININIIPRHIYNAFKRYNRSNSKLVEYSIDRGRLAITYEFDLLNGKELKFNKNGNLKEVE